MANVVDENISALMQKHLSLKIIKEDRKIKCSLSGHEMPWKASEIVTYVNGKKYKKLKAKEDLQRESYMQHLEPHKRTADGSQLFCKLTGRSLNNLPHHIQRHVQGRRFQKALKRWNDCQKTGEVFKPCQPMFPKNQVHDGKQETDEPGGNAEELWEGPDDSDQEADDMKDLYPDSDVESDPVDPDMDSESAGSDFEFDDRELTCYDQQSTSPSDDVDSTESINHSSKRKQIGDHKANKKVKVAEEPQSTDEAMGRVNSKLQALVGSARSSKQKKKKVKSKS